MKRNVLIMALLFIVSSFSVKLAAQENIHAVVKKCENNKNVDITYTKEKKNFLAADDDPLLGRHETYQMVIRGDEATLIKEFEAAFKKDREKAIKISESKKEGKLVSATYIFNGITYSLIFVSKEESKTTTLSRTNFANSISLRMANPIDPMVMDSLRLRIIELEKTLQNK